jgi:acetyl-CoA synthetase
MHGFLEARDLLRKYGSEYELACREFRWPDLDSFNWALDYFDATAKGNDRVALHVVDDAGSEEKLTFAEFSERSNRVANFLRAAGVRRGDRILIMLGNVVPLWELTLAAIKLGAVFSPATAMLTTADLQDRIDRGQMRPCGSGCPERCRRAGVAIAPPAKMTSFAAMRRRPGETVLGRDPFRVG